MYIAISLRARRVVGKACVYGGEGMYIRPVTDTRWDHYNEGTMCEPAVSGLLSRDVGDDVG